MKIPLMEYDQALALSLELIKHTPAVEEIALEDAMGRILSQSVVAREPLPKATNSAMDGFALRLEDVGRPLEIVQTIYAGQNVKGIQIPTGACAKIMTGALVPKGAEIVVPFEEMDFFNHKQAQAPAKTFKQGANIRFMGEDIHQDELIAHMGTRIHAGTIALLASQGIARVQVFKQLKIAIFSSGDEVVALGTQAQEHQIYDSNAPMLASLLKSYGHHIVHIGRLGDNLESQCQAMQTWGDYDVVVSSAGVSVGDRDYFKDALLQQGAIIHYHGVNLKPGKPIMLASFTSSVRPTFVFGMPGNPVSCMLTCLTLVLPMLEKLAGACGQDEILRVPLSEPLFFKGQRLHLVLGHVKQGVFTPYRHNRYGSGAIDALGACNALALIKPGVLEVKESVEVLFYQRFL
ncbi:molybdopterin molybdotransferase MoeA [Helicobacter baculiformis]|uniref:Molybdopterin molybdenumtransferase n=1 Tax=Helicobacter baculiformis TaxID=427351 RepID=A0ABV7ZHA2_9HELI|nr:molybdopterin molybdotransferase MoeA [Helicobacter baculiformis]